MSLDFVVNVDMGGVFPYLDKVSDFDRRELLETLGQLGEQQTKKRIEDGGPAPSGEPWKAWSKGYAKGRGGGKSLLRDEGNLLDSIAAQPPSGNDVSWGSNLIYAAVHQEGATIKPVNAKALVFEIGGEMVFASEVEIPARPYIGLSRDNQREMEQVALEFVAGRR